MRGTKRFGLEKFTIFFCEDEMCVTFPCYYLYCMPVVLVAVYNNFNKISALQ